MEIGSELLFSELGRAWRESLLILGATALLSAALGLPLGVLIAAFRLSSRAGSKVFDFVSLSVNVFVNTSVPAIILCLILEPGLYKQFFQFSSLGIGATVTGLAFLFSLKFAVAVETVLTDFFRFHSETLLSLGASRLQTARILIFESREYLWMYYLTGLAGVLTVTSGAGLTQLAYVSGYHSFQSGVMLGLAGLVVLMAMSLDVLGFKLAERRLR